MRRRLAVPPHLRTRAGVLQTLQYLCLFAVLWSELLVFRLASLRCSWPGPRTAARVLVVADVQFIDFYAGVGERLSRVVADLHMRRSWSAVRRFGADAVV
ncbi:hypothetical protein AURDEDRAFT_175542, partial [Auricularia subglabra TFB-10046 SS5]